jgi:hypothetical protein
VSQSGYSNYETLSDGISPRAAARVPATSSGGTSAAIASTPSWSARAREGQNSGPFIERMRWQPDHTSVSLSLKVEKARALAGEWRATKLVGTLAVRRLLRWGA